MSSQRTPLPAEHPLAPTPALPCPLGTPPPPPLSPPCQDFLWAVTWNCPVKGGPRPQTTLKPGGSLRGLCSPQSPTPSSIQAHSQYLPGIVVTSTDLGVSLYPQSWHYHPGPVTSLPSACVSAKWESESLPLWAV